MIAFKLLYMNIMNIMHKDLPLSLITDSSDDSFDKLLRFETLNSGLSIREAE